jgi:hypothetical protein
VHVFDEGYRERYMDAASDSPSCLYDTLPVMDGLLWSTDKEKAGVYLCDEAGNLLTIAGAPNVQPVDETTLRVSALLAGGGSIVTTFHESAVECSVVGRSNWRLAFRWPVPPEKIRIGGNAIHYVHEQRTYSVQFDDAELHSRDAGVIAIPTGDQTIQMCFERNE